MFDLILHVAKEPWLFLEVQFIYKHSALYHAENNAIYSATNTTLQCGVHYTEVHYGLITAVQCTAHCRVLHTAV